MNKELEEAVRMYIDKVGVDAATEKATNGFEDLIGMICESDRDVTPLVKFRMAIIEFLFFFEDTEEKSICLVKKIIDDIQAVSKED